MLADIKNDLMYLLNILESVAKIKIYSADCLDAEEFYRLNEQMNFNASLNLFANLGENIGKISDQLKQLYPKISWHDIKNLRNRIVHDYINIDMFVLFEVIQNDLEQLKNELNKIIFDKLKDSTFDIVEYESAKSSEYYQHIDFSKIGH